jgi:hypothetical protein
MNPVDTTKANIMKWLRKDAKSWMNKDVTVTEAARKAGKKRSKVIAFQKKGCAFKCLCNKDGTAKEEYKWA